MKFETLKHFYFDFTIERELQHEQHFETEKKRKNTIKFNSVKKRTSKPTIEDNRFKDGLNNVRYVRNIYNAFISLLFHFENMIWNTPKKQKTLNG